jgi:alkanesulfonate monooxygenase SsuD/methylene tetrahydromethanopterin reductase-like flavin-dependent oxidoreductase (luciferase family)
MPEERLRMVLTLGDPDEVVEQVQALLDGGLDALVFHLPTPYDLDLLALAGETLSAAVASRA